MRRCDSAAIVPNTSELLPEPETPVNTVRRRLGISMLTSLRLFTRAPCTRMRSCVSAMGLLMTSPDSGLGAPPSLLGERDIAVAVAADHRGPQLEQHIAVGRVVPRSGHDPGAHGRVVDLMAAAGHRGLATRARVVGHAVVQGEPSML